VSHSAGATAPLRRHPAPPRGIRLRPAATAAASVVAPVQTSRHDRRPLCCRPITDGQGGHRHRPRDQQLGTTAWIWHLKATSGRGPVQQISARGLLDRGRQRWLRCLLRPRGGSQILYSTDGDTWQAVRSPLATASLGVATYRYGTWRSERPHSPGRHYGLTSPDGRTWDVAHRLASAAQRHCALRPGQHARCAGQHGDGGGFVLRPSLASARPPSRPLPRPSPLPPGGPVSRAPGGGRRPAWSGNSPGSRRPMATGNRQRPNPGRQRPDHERSSWTRGVASTAGAGPAQVRLARVRRRETCTITSIDDRVIIVGWRGRVPQGLLRAFAATSAPTRRFLDGSGTPSRAAVA